MHNEKTFTKTIKETNNYFYFKFLGNPKRENINYVKITRLINNCFNESKNHNDMIRNVTWIRTILADFDEEYLEIQVINPKKESSQLIYENKEIKLYHIINKAFDEFNNSFNMKYDLGRELNFSFSVQNSKVIEYPNYQNRINFINESMNKLYTLNTISPIKMDQTSKALCKIYRLFYGEYPDFSAEDINIKIQSMMSILTEFGVSIDDKISFMMLKNKMPISLYLQDKIKNMTPLGKIEVMDNSVKLTEHTIKVTKVIRECIMESIPDEYEKKEVLTKISSIFYTKNNIVSSKAKISEVASICNSVENEVKATLKLVRKINDKI